MALSQMEMAQIGTTLEHLAQIPMDAASGEEMTVATQQKTHLSFTVVADDESEASSHPPDQSHSSVVAAPPRALPNPAPAQTVTSRRVESPPVTSRSVGHRSFTTSQGLLVAASSQEGGGGGRKGYAAVDDAGEGHAGGHGAGFGAGHAANLVGGEPPAAGGGRVQYECPVLWSCAG